MSGSAIASYYDRLTRWNNAARRFGYGGGRDSLTVHRGLSDPRHGGRATTTRLHDVICAELAPHAPRLLDAGCGLGGTMIALVRRWGGRATGVTLSQEQAAVARAAVRSAGLAESVTVSVRSYDDPPHGPFDIVIAIESLLHSDDPGRSVAALAAALVPGGVLVIVDDMPQPGAAGSAGLERFRRGWACGAMWGRARYLETFRSLGLTLQSERDLTAECRPRSAARLSLLGVMNRLVRRLVGRGGLRAVLESHDGGLALEQLLRDRLITYRMLVARKPD